MTGNKFAQSTTDMPTLNREDDLIAGSMRQGLLNQLIREQLAPSALSKNNNIQLTAPTDRQKEQNLCDSAVAVVKEIIFAPTVHRETLHEKLSELFYLQKEIYEAAEITAEVRKKQYISQGGLVLSPDYCITTLLDDLRVRSFIRGIHAAITDLLARRSIINIVYPACGPFAPLLIPLIAYYKHTNGYSPSQLQITLIDIQPGATKSLEALVEKMGLENYITEILCEDALTFSAKDQEFDLVLIEAMQHGLSREGHFAIARHFSRLMASEGKMLPQELVIKAVLNDPNREFIEQWRNAKYVSMTESDPEIFSERVVLGEVARINQSFLLNCETLMLDEHTQLIEFETVQVPVIPQESPEQLLMICSELQVYDNEWIREYDSGITQPLPDTQVCVNFTPKDERPGDLLVKSGDSIKFFYRLNGLPGFLATISVEGASE